jgi:hypothetical protein
MKRGKEMKKKKIKKLNKAIRIAKAWEAKHCKEIASCEYCPLEDLCNRSLTEWKVIKK